MRKFFISFILTTSFLITGCSQNKDFQIKPIHLSEEQSQLLTLTGNRVSKYSIQNLNNEKPYEIKVVYELYKNKEKIKDEQLWGMLIEPTNKDIKDIEFNLNIQDDKIRCMSGGSYSYLDIDEDIHKFSYETLSTDKKINLGDDIYLFKGFSGESGTLGSGSGVLSQEEKDKMINENEMCIFIKLICE